MNTLRDEVAAAFDKAVEADPEPVAIETAGPESTEVVDDGDAETFIDPPDVNDDAGDGVDPPDTTVDVEAKAPVVESDAPASWTAAEKAAWAKIPAELKAPILRREKEIRENVRVDGTARKFVDSINQTIQPFAGMLDKTGLNPVNVMRESLVLAEAMNNGTPEQKAATLGKMIRHFKVDIEKLDNYLVDPANAKPAVGAPQPVYDARKDPALSPLFAMAKEAEVKQLEAADKEIAEAATWPGFEEARNDMADLIEYYDTKGQKMSLGQAYSRITGNPVPKKATVTNIDTSGKRPTQQQISDAAAVLAKSRKAASSVEGNRRSPPAVNTDDIRSTVAAAANGLL